MTGYTKLFGSIVASTIWRESKETKIVWITMLALANKEGVVEASVPGLADLARVTVQECEDALSKLQAPDTYSRTKAHEGRRIQAVEGGWLVLNHAKYRAKMNADERREYLRLKQAEWRAKQKSCQHGVNKCSDLSTPSTHAEAEAEAYTDVPPCIPPKGGSPTNSKFKKPSLPEVQLQASKIGLPISEAERFLNYYESNGWRVGKNPMKSWPHALTNWKVHWEEHGRPMPPKTLSQKLEEEEDRRCQALCAEVDRITETL